MSSSFRLTSRHNRHGRRSTKDAFVADVPRARDEDFQLTLNRAVDRAATAFKSKTDSLEGFWILLGASCMLDLFERVGSETAAQAGAVGAFARNAEALVLPMKAGLRDIGKGCLTGVTVLDRALAANEKNSWSIAGDACTIAGCSTAGRLSTCRQTSRNAVTSSSGIWRDRSSRGDGPDYPQSYSDTIFDGVGHQEPEGRA